LSTKDYPRTFRILEVKHEVVLFIRWLFWTIKFI